MVQTRLAAALLGALLGAAGIVVLAVAPQVYRGTPNAADAIISAMTGALVGSVMGLWFRWRSNSWAQPPKSGRRMRDQSR